MGEDRYARIRSMPLADVVRVLGLDMNRFKTRKGGQEITGPCPIHKPKKNATSFCWNVDGRFQCWSCGAKGKGAIDLVCAVKGVGFQEAVRVLEPRAGDTLAHEAMQAARTPELKQVCELPSENPPFTASYEKFFRNHPWLADRGLTEATLKRYDVGYYENQSRRSTYNGSVMLKIRRWSDGQGTGYLSRNIGEVTPEEPKYRFPDGLHKSLELFGAWQLKEDGKVPVRILYLVESPFSVMKFHQLGLPAVSPFGWSVSEQQANIITEAARGVVYIPDRDKYKDVGTVVQTLSTRLWAKCPELPAGVDDPEYLTLDQVRSLT